MDKLEDALNQFTLDNLHNDLLLWQLRMLRLYHILRKYKETASEQEKKDAEWDENLLGVLENNKLDLLATINDSFQ